MNYSKSSIFVSPNVSEQETLRLSARLWMALTKELGSYLGHHINLRGNSRRLHEKVLQKLRSKLEGWKARILSRAGRITLEKSVLSGISVFFMQLQRFAVHIQKEIDRFVRRCV